MVPLLFLLVCRLFSLALFTSVDNGKSNCKKGWLLCFYCCSHWWIFFQFSLLSLFLVPQLFVFAVVDVFFVSFFSHNNFSHYLFRLIVVFVVSFIFRVRDYVVFGGVKIWRRCHHHCRCRLEREVVDCFGFFDVIGKLRWWYCDFAVYFNAGR